jgi:hypothetical protein
LTVKVIAVNTVESPWIWQDKKREWNWSGLDEAVILQAEGMQFEATASGYSLERNEILEDVNIVARLGEDGPILACIPTKAFWIRNAVEGVMFVTQAFDDGSLACTETMFGVKLPDGAIIKMTANGAGILFDDGSTVQNLTKGDFDEIDQYRVNMIKSATRQGGLCHTYSVTQNGVLVGWGHK